MNTSLEHWTPRERPSAEPMEGRYVRLEKLDSARHGDDLYVFVHVVDEFPMTVTGKVRKVEMREMAKEILGLQ